jgi:hypothetical protein
MFNSILRAERLSAKLRRLPLPRLAETNVEASTVVSKKNAMAVQLEPKVRPGLGVAVALPAASLRIERVACFFAPVWFLAVLTWNLRGTIEYLFLCRLSLVNLPHDKNG